MNDKFFQLPIEKQRRIINAAYRVFANNSYDKAPMSEIANEGGVSKSLLFHYFTNKKDLYIFLWTNAVEQIRKSSSEYYVIETTDFFEMLHRSLLAKCSVMRSYPYMYQFSINAYYEQNSDIKMCIQKSFLTESKNSEDIICKLVDMSKFRQDVNLKLIYQEILWVSDGYIRSMVLSGELDVDRMEDDFTKMIEQWRKVYMK